MPSPGDEAIAVGLGLGSNIGDRPANLRAAVSRLVEAGAIADPRVSSIYRTAPWGDAAQDDFANACAVATTRLATYDLLAACKKVEAEMGRRPTRRWGPRLIDIDILFYGNAEINSPALTIPHASLFERAFVLVPLAELAPDVELRGRRVAEAASTIDKEGVIVWRDDLVR